MQIEYSRYFIKTIKKAPSKVQEAFRDKLVKFIDNRHDQILHNHALAGKLMGCRSINITGDWRAIFEEYENGDVIFFVMIGTHSQLYK